jgi:anti-sigma regulatory factor (Ser/Thr protein kinase)
MTAGAASNSVKENLKMLGLPSQVVRRAAIITYEAEINLVIHGGGGILAANIDENSVEIMTTDHGPGIPDIGLAIQEGYTTASDHAREMGFGAGMGLPNIKKNADVFKIDSEVGKGTTLRTVINF